MKFFYAKNNLSVLTLLLTKSLTVCFFLFVFIFPAHSAHKEWTAPGGETDWSESSGWIPAGVPNNGDTVQITADVILSDTTAELASFINTGSVTFSGTDTKLRATEVVVEGMITHFQQSATETNASGEWVMDHRVWIVCSDLTVSAAGGSIDVSSNGYMRGCGPGSSPREGSAPSRNAASHGGLGYSEDARYPQGALYGSAIEPVEPGSGSGTNLTYGQTGGGVVLIEASGAVTVNGEIKADGGYEFSGYRYAAGGSGGSILIKCWTIRGTGTVTARGSQTWEGRGGGGGRIAVHYDSVAQAAVPEPTIFFDVSSEVLELIGCPGTLYFTDNTFYPYSVLTGGADILIPGFTNWGGSSQVVDNAWVRLNGQQVSMGGNLVVKGTYGRLDFNHTATGFSHMVCSVGITIEDGGAFYFYSGPTNDPAVRDYGALLTVTGTVDIHTNSAMYVVSEPENGGSALLALHHLYIREGGQLSADMHGYSYGQGPGLPDGRGGAGHGGAGGDGSYGAGGGVYGSVTNPISPGSGNLRNTDPGGGGVIRIESTGRITVEGTLSADGNFSPGRYGGGPSGGSIWIKTRRLLGNGSIYARGGDGHNEGGGGGGGGRIAVETWVNNFSGTLEYPGSVVGGLGGTTIPAEDGETGTLVLTLVGIPGTIMLIR